MGRKRVIIGQAEFGLEDEAVKQTITDIKAALETGGFAELELLDGAGRPVTVFVNGRAVETVVIDLDSGPRPSEVSV